MKILFSGERNSLYENNNTELNISVDHCILISSQRYHLPQYILDLS